MKRRSVKKNKKLKPISKELVGIILVFLGMLSFISIFSDKMGIFGNFLYRLSSNIAGRANFLLPLILMFLGTSLTVKSLQKNFPKYLVCSIILFLCLIIVLDTNKTEELTLVERMHFSKDFATVGKGGGVIGAVLGFFLYKIFGTVGTFIIVGILVLATIIYMTKFTPHKAKVFFENISLRIKKSREERQKKKRDKEIKTVDKKSKSLSERREEFVGSVKNFVKDEKSEEFVINDYEKSHSIEEVVVKEEKVEKNKKPKKKKIDETSEKDSIEEMELSKNLEDSLNEETFIYKVPPIELLEDVKNDSKKDNSEVLRNKKIIEDTMENFGIESKIVAINKGPVITSYELEPAPGVRLSKIVSLSDNLSLALASSDIRIEAPIPGKSVVGIEVPNKNKAAVTVREIIESDEFKNLNSHLPLALGKDVSGKNIISTIDKMPHLLVAGATGSGKSVCINTIITSILYKSSPEDVKLVLIDPKVVELSIYNGIPHLLIPVVTNPKKAQYALNWAVDEMEKRYKAFAENSVRDINGYNKKMKEKGEKYFPRIVVIVDELADLMMVSGQEVEDYIARLAQMARAAGIHLIIATQRPSVDVLTGTIKANIPSRIAFSVSSSVDSRTILDMGGAEKLLGKGDMIFYPSFYSKPKRVQGAFISDEEVERVIDFVKLNNSHEMPKEKENLLDEIEKKTEEIKDKDPLFDEAVKYILTDEQASISFLQRKLKVGYSRAARIVDQMEEAGIIGPHEGSKPRTIIMSPEEIEEYLGEKDE